MAELHRHYARLLEDQQAAHDLEMTRLNAEFPVRHFPTVESEEKAVKKAVRVTLRKTQKVFGYKHKAKVLLNLLKSGKLYGTAGREAF